MYHYGNNFGNIHGYCRDCCNAFLTIYDAFKTMEPQFKLPKISKEIEVDEIGYKLYEESGDHQFGGIDKTKEEIDFISNCKNHSNIDGKCALTQSKCDIRKCPIK